MKKEKFKLTIKNRKAIADMLTNCFLTLQINGRYKGKEEHEAATIELLIRHGYADIHARSAEGRILSVLPTEKAVYLIPVLA